MNILLWGVQISKVLFDVYSYASSVLRGWHCVKKVYVASFWLMKKCSFCLMNTCVQNCVHMKVNLSHCHKQKQFPFTDRNTCPQGTNLFQNCD